MKRILKISILPVLLLLLTGYVYFNNYESKSLTANSFTRKMKKLDFKIDNTIKNYKKNKNIIYAYQAKESKDKYAIEFLEFTSVKTAINYFTKEKNQLNNANDKDSVFNYTVIDDKEKYSINTGDNHYIVMTRSDNTILKYNIDSKYSEEVIKLTEEQLGY